MSKLTGDRPPPPLPVRTVAPRAVELRPQWAGPRAPFRHTWEGVVNVDQFRWLVRRDMQEQLELAQRELHARHVRAVGMFDDEMRVYCPSPGSFMGYESKRPRTNWQNVDYVMDSLLERRLRPMFTTSFIPSAMASGPVTVFTTKGHTSPPRDWAQWEAFVREAVEHAVERYTRDEVRHWYFEVWNEPNLPGWFWGGDQADFHRLWQTTYRAIKDVDARFRVGGPSTARAEWLDDFIVYGRDHDCPADYVIAHVYNNDSATGDALAPFAGVQSAKNSRSPDHAMDVMRDVRTRLDRGGFRGELHWNEWGRSFHGIDRRREHPSEAAFIARLLAGVSQQADVFAYWCLSDIYDQVGFGREAFHGGYGLLNLQGLRKPAYHVFQLLGLLGTERIEVRSSGTDSHLDAIATVSHDGRKAHVLVYAYDHDDDPKTTPIAVKVSLPGGAAATSLYRVDSTENNVVARWRELGAPAYLSREQARDLAADNSLQRSATGVRVESAETHLVAHFTMESPGVALLEVSL